MTTPRHHLDSEELKRRLLSWALTTRRYPLFKGSSEKLGLWFITVESACSQSQIPNTQRTEAAINLIHDDTPLAGVMRERQRLYLEKSGENYWAWADFKNDIIKVVMQAGTGTQVWLSLRRDDLLTNAPCLCQVAAGPGKRSQVSR